MEYKNNGFDQTLYMKDKKWLIMFTHEGKLWFVTPIDNYDFKTYYDYLKTYEK